jgi:hypothetical protein
MIYLLTLLCTLAMLLDGGGVFAAKKGSMSIGIQLLPSHVMIKFHRNCTTAYISTRDFPPALMMPNAPERQMVLR